MCFLGDDKRVHSEVPSLHRGGGGTSVPSLYNGPHASPGGAPRKLSGEWTITGQTTPPSSCVLPLRDVIAG